MAALPQAHPAPAPPSTPSKHHQWSLPLDSVAGIPVRLHYIFFGLLLFPLCYPLWGSGLHVLLAFIIYGPVCFVTVFLHELGLCIATRQVGGAVHGILLGPMGGLTYVGRDKSPARDLYVAVCGPLTHTLQFAVWYLTLVFSRRGIQGYWSPLLVAGVADNFWLAVCFGGCVVNIVVMAWHLVMLPLDPMDGGRIFVDLLLLCGVPVLVAAKALLGVSIVIGVAIIVLGAVYHSMMTIFTTLVGVGVLGLTAVLFVYIRLDRIEQHAIFCFEPAAAPLDPHSTLPANPPQSTGV